MLYESPAKVVHVVLNLAALACEPERDLLLGVDAETPLVLEHLFDGEPRHVEAEVSLCETRLSEPVTEGLLPDSGGTNDQRRRPIGVTVASEDFVQGENPAGGQRGQDETDE